MERIEASPQPSPGCFILRNDKRETRREWIVDFFYHKFAQIVFATDYWDYKCFFLPLRALRSGFGYLLIWLYGMLPILGIFNSFWVMLVLRLDKYLLI